MEPFSFNELPPEIQEQVLTSNPSLIRSSRRLSSNLSELTQRSYYNEFCPRPISNQEINLYINSYPKLFAIYYNRYSYFYADIYFLHSSLGYTRMSCLVSFHDNYWKLHIVAGDILIILPIK